MIAIIANGTIRDDRKIASLLKQYTRIIAVDGGLNHCKKMGITPHFFVGDGDSYDITTLSLPHKIFPKEKDESDLELAIEGEIEAGAKKITLFGALEGRLDHTLANLALLTRYPNILSIETENEQISLLPNESTFPTFPGQTLSLMPLNGSVTEVSTQGLKWEIQGNTLNHEFLSLSNEAIGTSVSVSYKEGFLLCSLLKNKEQ